MTLGASSIQHQQMLLRSACARWVLGCHGLESHELLLPQRWEPAPAVPSQGKTDCRGRRHLGTHSRTEGHKYSASGYVTCAISRMLRGRERTLRQTLQDAAPLPGPLPFPTLLPHSLAWFSWNASLISLVRRAPHSRACFCRRLRASLPPQVSRQAVGSLWRPRAFTGTCGPP